MKKLSFRTLVVIFSVLLLVGIILFLLTFVAPRTLVIVPIIEKPIIEKPIEQNLPVSAKPKLDIEPYLLKVNWLAEPEPLNNEPKGEWSSKEYIAGEITNGPLQGNKIYLIDSSDCMGGEHCYSHVLTYKGEKISIYKFGVEGVTDLPTEVSVIDVIPNNYRKLKQWYGPTEFFSDIKNPKKVFTSSILGDLYYNDQKCIVKKLSNGMTLPYDFVLPMDANGGREGIFDLIFDDGIVNKNSYVAMSLFSGCDNPCLYGAGEDVEKLQPTTRLKKIGKTSLSEPVYELINPQDPDLLALYNDKNTMAYYDNAAGYTKLGTSKYSYQQFLDSHPIIFWQDPVGRWLKFVNKNFTVLAEKCKPVIYLYPTETTKLNVKVVPNGGLTKTIPTYPTGGWNVEATPDSEIKDLSSNKIFPYLYWSGFALNYPVDKTSGWIVNKNSISKFLDEKLPQLGMNEKEISDFKDYWVAKLSEKPFYKINFLSKNDIDYTSPLVVSPAKPDSVIRVEMVAEGLDSAENLEIKEQILPPRPARHGFTVVEWGGVLLR